MMDDNERRKEEAEDGAKVLPLGEALVSSSWQTRRLAWQRIGKLEEVSDRSLIANAFANEQNASALDAALEGIDARFRSHVSSAAEVEALVEEGLGACLVKKGLGSSRASSREKANTLIETMASLCPFQCVEALADGLGTEEGRRGSSGRIPTSCARLLARHPEECSRLGAKLERPLAKLFEAASADSRLAAAELALALEGRGLAFLEELGPSAQKSIERARTESTSSFSFTAKTTEKPASSALRSNPSALEETTSEEHQAEHEIVSGLTCWSSSTVFWNELLQRCRDQGRSPDESNDVTMNMDFGQLFSREAWLARKGAIEAVALVCAEKNFFDDGARAEAALQADDLIDALALAAASEAHAKVAIAAIEALAASIILFGSKILDAVKRGLFPPLPSEEKEASTQPTIATALQRARDKRFAPALNTLLKALSQCDAWIAFESQCLRSVASLCSPASKRRLPPAGRSVLFDWIAAVPGRSRRKLLGVETYARLAAADANERDATLRTAAVSALASLALLGNLSLDAIATVKDDKRLRAKLDELMNERRPAFTAKADHQVNASKQQSNPKKTKQPGGIAEKRIHPKRPASAPSASRAASSEKNKGTTSQQQQRLSEPLHTRATELNTKSTTRWYPANPRPPSTKAIPLKDVVPPSIRTALAEHKDKDSWKRRREALERILSACGKVGRGVTTYLEATKDVKQLVCELRPRLADAQAKLRPIACDALAAVLYAIEPREAAARIGAKLGARAAVAAVLDSSRGVRGPALYALAACVAEASDGTVLPRALADAASQLGAALAGNASPTAKPDLLDWLEKRASFFPSGEISDDADLHLVPALLGLMTDKNKDCRDKSQACLGALLAHRAVSTNAVTNYLRDALPAARRLLEPRIEDLWRQLEEITTDEQEAEDACSQEEADVIHEDESPEETAHDSLAVSTKELDEHEKDKDEVIKVSLESSDDAQQFKEDITEVKGVPRTDTTAIRPPLPIHQSDRDTTFEDPGDDESPRFSETGARVMSEDNAKIDAPPPVPKTETEDEEIRPQAEESAEISAMFTFSADDVKAPTSEASPLSYKPEPTESTDELWNRAFDDLDTPTSSVDARKNALKAIIYLCGLASLPEQLSDPILCATAAERLSKTVEDSVEKLGKKADNASKRFARLCVGAALSFARVARLGHAAIRAFLGAATRSAAAPVLETDFEIRSALNDLAVTVALETPKAQALAAVLDLLGGPENDRLVLGQLARVVHLVSTVTTEEEKTPSFWGEIRSGTIQNKDDEKSEVSALDAALASRILPVILSAHQFLEDAAVDHAKRLAFDAAKTIVALLTDTVGLDIILLAGKQGGLSNTSPIFQFATKLAGDEGKPQSTPISSHRIPTHQSLHNSGLSTNAVARNDRGTRALGTASSLKERLNEVKQRGAHGPPPTITAASASLGDDAAARIAELRRRLAASSR